MSFEELKYKNKEIIRKLESKIEQGLDKDRSIKDIVIHKKINELLCKDRAIFFKISIKDSYKILGQIIDNEELLKNAYIDLTSPKEYKRLMTEFKI